MIPYVGQRDVRKTPAKLTSKERLKMVQMYVDGVPPAEIAKIFGVHKDYIRSAASRMGMKKVNVLANT